MSDYEDFIKSKIFHDIDSGFDVELTDLNPMLFDFQKAMVKWALKRGRSAMFADCGLGKTPMQLEWALQIYKKTQKNILILAPLAVSKQTFQEGLKFNIKVNVCRTQKDVKPGINITNYEMLDHFESTKFIGIVLDESSILKSYSGKRKQQIINTFKDTKFKLACTATPSPNDHMEILNHSAFLNVMESHEALAIWFINKSDELGAYRLKHHAIKNFWKWVSSWAVSLQKPEDLGFENNGFNLPNLYITENLIEIDQTDSAGDMLFRIPALSATDYHKEKRLTIPLRAEKVKNLVDSNNGIYCIWCETNYEADELKKQLPNAIEIRGSHSDNTKEQVAIDFANGKIPVLISKPSIFGFGMNFQKCNNVIFCGLSYSYESFYQATRRFWRFGQTKDVNVQIVLGDTEKNILNVLRKKNEKYNELKTNMQKAMSKVQNIKSEVRYKMEYNRKEKINSNYTMILGDAVKETKKIKTDSIHFTLFSPPFSSLYIYSENYHDMGNSQNDNEFFKHFEFLIPDLYRVTIPGRLCAVHCKQLVNYKHRDGASGLRDFRGDLIRSFQKHKWVYHSEICIWKSPVTEMYRTKSHGLLYKTLRKDSSFSRQGLPDYILLFRKWADEDPEPIVHTKDDFPLEDWQEYASPVWFKIRQTNVLNAKLSKESKDEKHICPLQLDVIERCMRLWSNPNDLVFSPFAGIGSEGYIALKLGRRFVGMELKESYFKTAINNLEEAKKEQGSLF